MEPLLVHTGVSASVLEVSSALSILLTGLVGMVWGTAARIGILVCQHFLARTPMAPHHTPPVTFDEQATAQFDHHAIKRGVCRDVEPERGRTGGMQ
jgi:hypothetical protein